MTERRCKRCWGKGYSTLLEGGNFKIYTCECDRGKQIKKYFNIKRKFKF